MKGFVFVTHSIGKLTEVERILGQKLEHGKIDLPEIQAVEIEDVVLFKIKKAYQEFKKPVIIEDTGLFIEALNGLPGALVKWFIERIGDVGICGLLNKSSNRKAWAKTVVATYDGISNPKLFIGQVDGQIARNPSGTGGFGWDKIFIPNGSDKTFGEMSGEEKDKYSMRRKAFEKMDLGDAVD